jgi:uncharacterized lipoprotein YddW (UPF0748 family)
VHRVRVGWMALGFAVWALWPANGPDARSALPGEEFRALWVQRSSLTSPASVAAVVRAARAAGFNTILAQVRARGDAYYATSLAPRADDLAAQPPTFDPLETVIAAAHQNGLRVHAWINVNLAASAVTLPASPDHVVYRCPECLMVPQPLARELAGVDPASPAYLGRLARWTRTQTGRVEGLYLSPLAPAVHDHLAAVVADLVARYPVDGVHLDYVRYPDDRFDYSPAALEAFRRAVDRELPPAERSRLARAARTDPLVYPESRPDAWSAFRRAQLSGLVMRLRTVIRATRPGIPVSAAVVPDADEAFTRRLQDWRLWVENGWLDAVCPMAYTADPATFARQIAAARAFAGRRAVWAGIGAFRLPAAEVVAFIELARAQRADGVAIFSYDNLVGPEGADQTLAEIGRAFLPPPGAGSR